MHAHCRRFALRQRACSPLRFLLLQLRDGHVDVTAAILLPLLHLVDLPARHSSVLQQSAAVLLADGHDCTKPPRQQDAV